MENSQYMQMFLEESSENTQALNTLCLQLEQGQRDDDVFAAMFRAAHTLKGMSATMGFTKMATLTHRLEDALGLLRKSPSQLTGEIMDILFESLDALESNLQVIRDCGAEDAVDHSILVAKLTRVQSGEQSPSALASAPKTSAKSMEFSYDENLLSLLNQCRDSGVMTGVLRVKVDPACVMKGVRAVVVMRTIDSFADCLQCQPDPTVLEEGKYEDWIQFVVALQQGEGKDLVTAVQNISEIEVVQFSEVDAQVEVAATSTEQNLVQNEAPGTSESTGVEPKQMPSNAKRVDKVDRTIRVSVERLDTLMNMLSELVIDKTRLSSLAGTLGSTDLEDLTNHISRVSNELQASVMSLRMVPVDSLFQRFPRMVRDLSKSLNKQIQLEMTGLETELDRTVIDEMGEALVHLIRNAADHGLESTDARLAAGKQAAGNMRLSAYASGQNVFIEVADDGGGINRGKVLEKALANQLCTPSRAAEMSDEQVFMLLFESGFSTAETVSDISGRGVGLDAVKRKVESLGGKIGVESSLGIGTTFRIQLPLTLAILQSLLVVVKDEVFAIPLGSVEEVIVADVNNVKHVHGQTILNYRGKLVPIVDAGEALLDQRVCGEMPWQLVVCKEGTKRLAIAVDGFLGQQEIVNKSLGLYLSHVKAFSGATILGDGNIALIMDVHHWMSM